MLARAEGDPPGRVGRLADLQGAVSVYDIERGEWAAAQRNRPLTSGDRLSTAAGGRAELRVGSTVLRLAASSELEVLRLDDDRLDFQLHAGSLALRVRVREVANEIAIVTAEARLRPLRSGSYRIDRLDDSTFAGSTRGELQVDDPDGFVVDSGKRSELWREGARRELRHAAAIPANDAFSAWVAGADRDDERSAASRYVSPEMTGIEDLDRYGRWDQHPDHGAVWVPVNVSVGWAPYRHGRWAWVRPWGWTWVDEAPWGFAPFHYGRWLSWGGRWCWTPGAYVARPVYAPALVGWIGGPPGVYRGGPFYPGVGWVPLAPREIFVPHYGVTPVYIDRVNRGQHPPGRVLLPVAVPAGPVFHANQSVPGAMTQPPRNAPPALRPVLPVLPGLLQAPVPTPVPAPLPAPLPAPVSPAALPYTPRSTPPTVPVRAAPPAVGVPTQPALPAPPPTAPVTTQPPVRVPISTPAATAKPGKSADDRDSSAREDGRARTPESRGNGNIHQSQSQRR